MNRTEDLHVKSAKKRSTAPAALVPAAKSSSPTSGEPKSKQAVAASKQSRVITMLRSPDGATIAAMMKELLAAALSARLPRRNGAEKVEAEF